MAALRAELEAAMAKALADLEARLKAEHAAEIQALLADAAAKLAAALAALRAELEAVIAALKAQAERDAAELARLRGENDKLKADLENANKVSFKYEIVRKELAEALEMPIGKTVGRMTEIIEELKNEPAIASRERACLPACLASMPAVFFGMPSPLTRTPTRAPSHPRSQFQKDAMAGKF
jgi:hypothetical protein